MPGLTVARHARPPRIGGSVATSSRPATSWRRLPRSRSRSLTSKMSCHWRGRDAKGPGLARDAIRTVTTEKEPHAERELLPRPMSRLCPVAVISDLLGVPGRGRHLRYWSNGTFAVDESAGRDNTGKLTDDEPIAGSMTSSACHAGVPSATPWDCEAGALWRRPSPAR